MRLAVLVLSGYLAITPAAKAQSAIYVFEDYATYADRASAISAIGADGAFGESVDLNSGTTSFSLEIVNIPGNNKLDVSARYRYETYETGQQIGFRWIEDIPHLEGVYSSAGGWLASPGGNQRCSSGEAGVPVVPNTDGKDGTFEPEEYWKGNWLVLPGGQRQLMRVVLPSTVQRPATGGPYKWVTNENWFFSCIPLTLGVGEGFLAISPEGTKYFFDQLVKSEYAPTLRKYNWQGDTRLQRRVVRISPSRIEDRFGNYVTYSNQNNVKMITSNDGRQLTISGNTITAGGRTWTVNQMGNNVTVTYPDGSAWVLTSTGDFTRNSYSGTSCNDSQNQTYNGTAAVEITLPSGAKGKFELAPRLRGYSYVDYTCYMDILENGGAIIYVQYPNVITDIALVRKTISGPGITASADSTATPIVYDLDYGPINNCYTGAGFQGSDPPGKCIASSPVTRTVTVTGSDGSYKRYVFGNKALVDAGLLLRTEIGRVGQAPLQVTSSLWKEFDGIGHGNAGGLDYLYSQFVFKQSRLEERVIRQEGVDFRYKVNTFDTFARPLSITRSSATAP